MTQMMYHLIISWKSIIFKNRNMIKMLRRNFLEWILTIKWELVTTWLHKKFCYNDVIVESVTSNDEEEEVLDENDSAKNVNVATIPEMTKKMCEMRNFLEWYQISEHKWLSLCKLESCINRNVQSQISDFMK